MKIPNYKVKVDRIINKAIMSCVGDPGIRIAIVCGWRDGIELFDRVSKKGSALKVIGTAWYGEKSIRFANGSGLYVIDGKGGWEGKGHEFSTIYLVCDMWELDSEEQAMMRSSLAVKTFVEIHRIRYPAITTPTPRPLRGMTSSFIYYDDF